MACSTADTWMVLKSLGSDKYRKLMIKIRRFMVKQLGCFSYLSAIPLIILSQILNWCIFQSGAAVGSSDVIFKCKSQNITVFPTIQTTLKFIKRYIFINMCSHLRFYQRSYIYEKTVLTAKLKVVCNHLPKRLFGNRKYQIS